MGIYSFLSTISVRSHQKDCTSKTHNQRAFYRSSRVILPSVIYSTILLGCHSNGLSDTHLTLTSDAELSTLSPLTQQRINELQKNGALPTALMDAALVNSVIPPTQPNDRYIAGNSLAAPLGRERFIQTIPGLPPDPLEPNKGNQHKVTILAPIQELRTTNPQTCINIVGLPYSHNPRNSIPTPQSDATASFFGIEYFHIHEDLLLFSNNSDAQSVFTTIVTTKQKCPSFRLRSPDGYRFLPRILKETVTPHIGDRSLSYIIADQKSRRFSSAYHIGYVLCGPIILRVYADTPTGTLDKEFPKLVIAATQKLLK